MSHFDYDINGYVKDFEDCLKELKRRYNDISDKLGDMLKSNKLEDINNSPEYQLLVRERDEIADKMRDIRDFLNKLKGHK